MSRVTVCLYVDRGDDELELEVSGRVTAGSRATRDYPGDPPEVEIVKVTLDGEPWSGELTATEVEDAEERLYEAASEEAFDHG